MICQKLEGRTFNRNNIFVISKYFLCSKEKYSVTCARKPLFYYKLVRFTTRAIGFHALSFDHITSSVVSEQKKNKHGMHYGITLLKEYAVCLFVGTCKTSDSIYTSTTCIELSMFFAIKKIIVILGIYKNVAKCIWIYVF